MATYLVGRLLHAIIFAVIGWQISTTAPLTSIGLGSYVPWGLAITLTSAAIGGLIGPYLTYKTIKSLFDQLSRVPSSTVIAGTIGLVVGLVVAILISIPFFQLNGWVNWGIPLIISAIMGFAGLSVGIQRAREFSGVVPSGISMRYSSSKTNDRILVDTSAIIDGRIADMSRTGFVQGTLLIPRFILDELRHIADSSDSLRRTKGRRGLEILSNLRKEGDIPVQILDVEMVNQEVDAELVHLAKRMKAQILTTDFNLNRVAELQGVNVLNINELANSLKPVVLPGEEIGVNIIQSGKEPGQGVAYLDDGTMVVVDGGKRFINSVQGVTVTRVLQTAAGRIIFAQLRSTY